MTKPIAPHACIAVCVFVLMMLAAGVAAADAVDVAAQQIGKRYVWGAQGSAAFDCSSLTQYAYRIVGTSLPRTSAGQSSSGIGVTGDLQRGDLLFFATSQPGVVSHVGIYEGGNVMINANSYYNEVRRDRIDDEYWSEKFMWARRPLAAPAWSTIGHDSQRTGLSEFVGPQAIGSPAIMQVSNRGINWNGPPAITGDRVVYVVTTRAVSGVFVDAIEAFDPNGVPVTGWPFVGPSGAPLYASPSIGPDGTIYAGFGSDLYAIRPDGSLRWSTPFRSPGGIFSAPAVDDAGNVYVAAVANGAPLFALNPDGTARWQTSGVSGHTPVALGRDGAVFVAGGPVVGFSSGGATAFNPDGTVRWQSGFGGSAVRPTSFSSALVGLDGTLYAVIGGGSRSTPSVVAINPASATVEHEISVPGVSVVGVGGTLALLPDGRIACLTSDARIVVFLSDLTAVSFSYVLAPFSGAYSLAVGSDGTIYASLTNGPNQTGKVIALGSDGVLKGEYVTAPNTQLGPPAIGPDGALVVGTSCCFNGDLGRLYTFPR